MQWRTFEEIALNLLSLVIVFDGVAISIFLTWTHFGVMKDFAEDNASLFLSSVTLVLKNV